MARKPVEITRRKVTVGGRAGGAGIVRRRVTLAKMPDLVTAFAFEDDEDSPFDGIVEDLKAGVPLQQTADAEMSGLIQVIRDNRAAKGEQFRVERDKDYYVAICFQSHEQRDDFLKKAGLGMVPLTMGLFMNGLQAAQAMGIEIEAVKLEPLRQRGRPKNYTREEVI